jgi:hypothetical protein
LQFLTEGVAVASKYGFLLCGFLTVSVITPAAPTQSLIALFSADSESILHDASVPIWGREEGVVIAGPSGGQLDKLRAQGIEPVFSAADHGEAIHVLSHDQYFTPPIFIGVPRFQINDRAMLYLIPAGLEMDLPRLKLHALFHGVPRVPLSPVRAHSADAASLRIMSDSAPHTSLPPIGLVQQIVDGTSQASWFQFVRDLSGDSDVTIPGFCTNCRIRTRASNYMFPIRNTGNPLGNPFATEYLENKAAGWGFAAPNAVRESYTSANSGCTTRQGSQTWQNVVFTLPAQVDYAQNQQVIFVVHYDTISESATNDANNAPGADDAISGGSALLEAMRLFKDYAWKYPAKFLFVTGEEVGLCGSTAYTRMHPTAPMWRVLNMDQTAFDGNKDGVMNLYNWNTTSCPSCVAFGDAFDQANSDYGNIINPTKILRNTTKMCQTDHCPFWNVGVTAIDLNEDLTDNDLCPCFDQYQTSTCRDSVTQTYPVGGTTLMFDQNYSWPTEKAAIALIASTAQPLYSCPTAGATLSAASGTAQVQLTWPDVPPVTNYVVERATGGCAGTFAGIASSTTTSYTDSAVTAGSTYGYRVRTCPFQVSNCVEKVVQGDTTTTVTSSPNPSTSGQSVTFTATVTGSGVPAGTVTFAEGSTVLASNVTVDGTGHASFSTTTLSVGSHTITATFTGNSGWLGSSGSDAGSPEVVNAASSTTSTTLLSSPNPSTVGQSVMFTSTTTSSAGAPVGTVTFTEGATVWASGVSVDGAGHASFSTTALAVGSHILTASFTGASGWPNSSGNSPSQVVNTIATTTTLSSSSNPSVFSQPVTFTAAVAPASSGGGVLAGTVTFKDGATALGTGTVDGSGNATFTTSVVAAGSHSITAVYGGSANFSTSTSPAVTQTVNNDATTTTVTSSLNPSPHNGSVTFTATVIAKAPGTATPTGTVTFKDGSRTLGSSSLSAGRASFSVSNLSKGTHQITATYGGSSGLLTSTTPILTQTVN